MTKDSNFEDRVRIEIDQLDLVMMKNVMEEVIGGKAKSSLVGRHWRTARDGRRWLNQFVEVIFIDRRGPEHLGVRGSHGNNARL
jgi:hypothetical protein